MNQRMHVIPIGHPEPLHDATMQCWCHPLEKDDGMIAVHNAKDCREKWERQGIIDQDKPWIIAYENLPNPWADRCPTERENANG